MKTKRTRVIVLCLLSWSISFSACMPVFDELNFLLNQVIQRVQKLLLEDIGVVLKDIKNLDELRYAAFMVSNYGLTAAELKSLTPPDITEILRRGSYITDQFQRDTWNRVWKRLESIFDRYLVLKDLTFITENPLYRKNPKVRRFMDENIERQAERLKNRENLLDLCATMREIEDERLDQIQKWERFLGEFGTIKDEATGAARTSKLLALVAIMKIESLKSDMQTNILERIAMENRVKEEIWDLDWVKRFLKNVNENYRQYRFWR